MTEEQIAAILLADQERVNQALWAAHCEMGPEPDYARRAAHIVYSKELRRRAEAIFRRLN